MIDKTDDGLNSNWDWCQQFAREALKRAAAELEAFSVVGNHAAPAIQRKLAEAAQEIGWAFISEIGSLVSDGTVRESRDNIITGLCDLLRNG